MDISWLKGKRKQVEQGHRDPRMYVLVRSDLPPGLQMAQAIHAASYLAADNRLALYQHPTVTVLNVEDEEALLSESAKAKVAPGSPEGFMFREPDLDGEATAFACYSRGSEWKHLGLALRNVVQKPKI